MEELLALVEKKADQFSDDERDDLDDMASLLKDNLKKIAESGERAVSIVQGILLVSRGKENEYVPTDVCKIVKEYVHLSYHAMRANHPGFNSDIHEQYEEGLPLMMVIPQDLSRAVLNVMNNACYAVWQKSQTAAADYTPEISISVAVNDKSLVISIADNGEGMNDEVKQRLFENFFTTKPIGHGTGLGMSITRDIIENKHSGKVTFTSTLGKGTTFTFTIPVMK
jgi:signal transduction histidine kinase